MHSVNYTQILKTYIQHVSAQGYHLQGEENAYVFLYCASLDETNLTKKFPTATL